MQHKEDAREQVEKMHAQLGTLHKLARTLQQEVRVLKMGRALDGEDGSNTATSNGLHSAARGQACADPQREATGQSMLA